MKEHQSEKRLLRGLPVEIWQKIGTHMDYVALFQLARASKELFQYFTPLLVERALERFQIR